MSDRRDRINAMCDSLCRGKRYEAADSHVEAMRSFGEHFPDIGLPIRDRFSQARWDFLAGWDEAMQLRHDELFDENLELHGIVMELCQRLCVERCKVCKGSGVNGELAPCPHCDNGWIDKP